jgi:hypothetical protein
MTEKESAHPSSRQLSELTLNNLLSPDSEVVAGQPKSLETLLENKVFEYYFICVNVNNKICVKCLNRTGRNNVIINSFWCSFKKSERRSLFALLLVKLPLD